MDSYREKENMATKGGNFLPVKQMWLEHNQKPILPVGA